MGIVTGKQDAAMTSTNGQHATEVSDGLPLPPAQDQELLLDAWREALGLALYERDCEWKEKVRVMAAESMAAIAELRAAAAEFRSTMESMIAARLAQIRQPVVEKGRAARPDRVAKPARPESSKGCAPMSKARCIIGAISSCAMARRIRRCATPAAHRRTRSIGFASRPEVLMAFRFA
jgi:hypothetical protein